MKHIVLTLTLITTLLTLAACNVTRTVTVASEAFQKGDTAVTITTRTVETYDAKQSIYHF